MSAFLFESKWEIMETMKAPNEMSRSVETRTAYHINTPTYVDLHRKFPKRREKKLSVGIICGTYAIYYATRSFRLIFTVCLVCA